MTLDHSRRPRPQVGSHLSRRCPAVLALDALEIGIWTRRAGRDLGALIRDSDKGRAVHRRALLSAAAEERLDRQRWATRGELRLAIIAWIERALITVAASNIDSADFTPAGYETLTHAAAAA